MKSFKLMFGASAMAVFGASAVLADNGSWGTPHPSAAACYETTQIESAALAQLEQGLKSCHQALSKGPHTHAHKATVHYNSALIYRDLGDTTTAQQHLDEAMVLDPSLTEAVLLGAILAHQVGDYQVAADLYDQLLEEHLNDEPVVENRLALERNLSLALASLDNAVGTK